MVYQVNIVNIVGLIVYDTNFEHMLRLTNCRTSTNKMIFFDHFCNKNIDSECTVQSKPAIPTNFFNKQYLSKLNF